MRARDNPFRTERILEIRYRPQGCSWDDLLRRLAGMDYRAAIVGPEGSGKTTLLEDLEPRLRALGLGVRMLRLDLERREFPAARRWADLVVPTESTDELTEWTGGPLVLTGELSESRVG